MGDRDCGEGIGDVEGAGQARRDAELAVGCQHGEAPLGNARLQLARAVCGWGVDRVADGVRVVVEQAAAVGVVGVDDGDRGSRLEEGALGGEVGLHVWMKVEVVLRQVREHRRGEVNRVSAVQRERVRGDLHRAGAVARVAHRCEARLQVDRLGGRVNHLSVEAADHGLDRSEQRALLAGRLEDLARQKGCRRLAVRSGDPDDAQRAAWIAEEARGQRGHRLTYRGHPQLGHAE